MSTTLSIWYFIEAQLAAGDSGNADSPQTMGMETSDDEGGNWRFAHEMEKITICHSL